MIDDTYGPEDWGWRHEFHAAWAAMSDPGPGGRPLAPARVTGRERHLYELVFPDFAGRAGFPDATGAAGSPRMARRIEGASVSGRFEYEARGPSDYPVTGDWVLVDPEEGGSRIHAALPRRTALSRGMAGDETGEQVLAVNVDTLLLVFGLDGGRNFLVRLLERALVAARNSGASACVVLNKADLASAEDKERAVAEASRAASVPVIAVSARTGEGLDELAAMLSPGETVGMLGKSGVGKSALVNALGGGAALAAEGANRDGDLRGRHTTTSSRLFRLGSGVLLIDGPGIRELKLWGDVDGLEGGFPEIAELAGGCRFADCSHSGEPGCAIREALESGAIEQSRYLAWLELRRELTWLERRVDDKARREDELRWKHIAKDQKAMKKLRD
ncbi:MAG: ribosome small subunit-dependent GTPase A [Spirochaetae bacterium HGW-Spirochaetae-3]|jgi:ribosome biogenesis GTPase|nr:MAG: ribosome small subunit-dependent GTPase A [Spirochaetae bacterium HGW-Spirochaetae-3]